jgi:hypothetical protein
MSEDNEQTKPPPTEFDFSTYPRNTLFHDRRNGRERRDRTTPAPAGSTPPASQGRPDRRAKKERRRRIDPTTFEKQYTDDEMEFMKAMQSFKELTGRNFPNFGDVLKVAIALGYRKALVDIEPRDEASESDDPQLLFAPTTNR